MAPDALSPASASGRFLPVATGCFVAGCGWSFFSRAELCPVRHQCPAQLTNKSLAYLYLKGRVGFKLIRGRTHPWAIGAKRFSMQNIFSEAAVSISELKKTPSRILAEAACAPVALLDQDRVMAYLVPAELYEQILERLDDFELSALAKARAAEKSIRVSLDDL